MFELGVQQVRFVMHTAPLPQPHVPPQPSLPQVLGRHEGVHAIGQSTAGDPCRYPNQLLTAVRPPEEADWVTRSRTLRPVDTEGESVPEVKRT